MIITNCHIHTFTIEHVPHKFLPLRLVRILRPKIIRKPLGWLLRNIIPFTDRDLLDRYESFMRITANRSQSDIFEQIRSYYPASTRFIILPMDMAYMQAGRIKKDMEHQHQELLALYQQFPDHVIPFIGVDPRREGVLEMVKTYVEQHGFRGIKIYPRLGFYPDDKRLLPVYDYAQRNNIPVIAHCSRGGVYTHKVTREMLTHPWRGKVEKMEPKEFSHYFTEPKNYDRIMTDFPDLRMCLAHFGGNSEWDKYLDNKWNPEHPDERNKSWVGEIIDLMKKHKNLYTDISYTAFHTDRYWPLMSVLLDDMAINQKILFGSDYYMVEREKETEREMSIRIRHALGERKFGMICDENIKNYLGGTF